MRNLIALGILVLLGIIAFVTLREKPDTEKEKVVKAIEPVDKTKVDTIKISRLEGIGDDKKPESYTLKKVDDTWKMVEPIEYPVVASTVDTMTKVLSELRVIDVISEKPESHSKFAVDDKNGVKVTVMSGKETLLDLILGSSKMGVTFVRLPGQNPVYRLKGSFKYSLDRSIKTLREKAVVNIEIEDLEKVTFKQKDATLTLAREGEADSLTVKPVGTEIEKFDDKKATSVARSAVRLNAVDFVDEKLPAETTGLDDTADTYTVVGKKDGKPYEVTVSLGKKMEDKAQVYTRTTDSDQIFLVSNFTADRLRAKAADFVKDEKKAAASPPAGKGGPAGLPAGLPPGVKLPGM